MASFLVPRRRYGTELLDEGSSDVPLVLRTLRDISRSNVVFQGTRAAVAEAESHFGKLGASATLLDVGTGAGDVPRAIERAAASHGHRPHDDRAGHRAASCSATHAPRCARR